MMRKVETDKSQSTTDEVRVLVQAWVSIDKMWVEGKLSRSLYNTFTHKYGKELRIRGRWNISRLRSIMRACRTRTPEYVS